MSILSESWRWWNVALVGGLAITMLVLCLRDGRRAAERAAAKMSLRLELPFGSAATHAAIAAWARRTGRWSLAAMSGGVLALTPLLATPLADQYAFMFVAVLPVVVFSSTAGRVVATLRERLFHPAPDVPRVARLQAMRTRDYLGPVRGIAPWIFGALLLAGLAVLIGTWTAAPARVDGRFAGPALVVSAIAILALAAYPWIARVIRARPQPAADTLELAWDDAIRTDSLSAVALAACQLCGVAGGLLVLATAGTDWTGLAIQLPTWGMILPQAMYLGMNGGLPLRPGLRPAPASAAGGAA